MAGRETISSVPATRSWCREMTIERKGAMRTRRVASGRADSVRVTLVALFTIGILLPASRAAAANLDITPAISLDPPPRPLRTGAGPLSQDPVGPFGRPTDPRLDRI